MTTAKDLKTCPSCGSNGWWLADDAPNCDACGHQFVHQILQIDEEGDTVANVSNADLPSDSRQSAEDADEFEKIPFLQKGDERWPASKGLEVNALIEGRYPYDLTRC